MKNFKYLYKILLVYFLTFLIYSCNEPIVFISVNQNIDSVVPGGIVKFIYTLTPDAVNGGNLGTFNIKQSDSIIYSKTYSGTTAITDSVEIKIPNDAVIGSQIELIFETKDAESAIIKTTNVSIIIIPVLPELISVNEIQATYISTSLTNQMMFDFTSTGVTMQGGDFNEGELAFVWQTTYGYSICSPNAQWISELFDLYNITYTTIDKQTTKIMKYTGAWESLTQKEINNLTITTQTLDGGGNGVQDLISGEIVVFETQDGRKGALKVNSYSKITKCMNADLKFQVSDCTGN